MPTAHQKTGNRGEKLVARSCSCPHCKRERSLKLLPKNFKCADVVCDFCGYLAQIKSSNVSDVNVVPNKVLGAAWGPQRDRMAAGIYFPLFLVLLERAGSRKAIYYLSADLQSPEMFVARKPLSPSARRAGWVGFYYDLKDYKDRFTRLL